MINIKENRLQDAIQIVLGENKIYTEKLEAALIQQIKALSIPVVVRSLPTKEEKTIEELKQEWVEVMNDFDSYEDKKEWQALLSDLRNRIEELNRR